MSKITTTLWCLFLLFLPFQLGKHFWLPFSYINGLRVDYLAPAIYLQDIMLFVLIITYLWKQKYSVKRIVVSVPKTLSVVLVLFVLSNIFSSFYPPLTFYSSLRLFQFIILVKLAVQEKEKIILLLKYVLPISAIIQLAISLTQIFTGKSVGGILYWLGERNFTIATPDIAKVFIFNQTWLRPYGTFSHPNSLAGFMLLVFVLGWVFITGKTKYLTILLSLLVVVLSFSQSAWLSLFIIICYLIISNRNISSRGLYISKMVCIPLVIYVLYLSRCYILNDPSFVLRLSLLKASWSIFLTHPIFGVGLGNFIVALGQQSEFSRLIHWYQPVHNIFVLWLVETGLFGTGFILYLAKNTFGTFKTPPKYPNNILNNLPQIHRISPVILILIVILTTGSLDHYWLTLIQNRLSLAVTIGLLIKTVMTK